MMDNDGPGGITMGMKEDFEAARTRWSAFTVYQIQLAVEETVGLGGQITEISQRMND